jgi:hypothetical protein
MSNFAEKLRNFKVFEENFSGKKPSQVQSGVKTSTNIFKMFCWYVKIAQPKLIEKQNDWAKPRILNIFFKRQGNLIFLP